MNALMNQARQNPANENSAPNDLYKGPLTQEELSAVLTVVSYVAQAQHMSQQMTQRIVTKAFGVKTFQELQRNQYDDVIRFLVDIPSCKAVR